MLETKDEYAQWIIWSLTKNGLMCSWICCRRDDPSLCMCPGWPWFCIHYPWVEAARTLEFKRGSLLTSSCILYQPWLNKISYNPIYVSWGVRAKHNTGVILSAVTQWVTCCVDIIHRLSQLYTWIDWTVGKDCGLIMTGRCLRSWQVWWSWLLCIKASSLS